MDDPCVQSHSSVCRLCLCGDESLISVFDENHTFLPQRIAACVNVEVHATDKMSTLICKFCLSKVEEWFDFKKCCEDSQSKLRQWLQTGSPAGKSLPMGLTIKEEIDSVDQLQMIDTSVFIKSEPLYSSEEEEEYRSQDTHAQVSPSNYNVPVVNNLDSLLVPALECPATVHGINAPYFSENGEYSNSNRCRICGKAFSNSNNRNRHERTVHSLEREASKHLSQDRDRLLEPFIDNSSDISSNVTIEQFAASLQLIQTNPAPVKPISEKQFLEYNRKMCNMLETGNCDFCNSNFSSSRNLLRHLAKKIKIERFSCFFCCISFPNRSQYMKHNLKKYCKQRARMIDSGNCAFKSYQHYECRLCKVLYVHKLLLTRHLATRHLSEIYPTHCLRCTTTLQNSDEHKEHLQGPCYYKIYCSICKATYDSLSDFESHTFIHDDNDSSIDIYLKNGAYNPNSESEISYTRRTVVHRVPILRKLKKKCIPSCCPVCTKRYSSYDNMLRHFKGSHKKYRLHKCHLCTRKFATEQDLRQHVHNVHEKDKASNPAANNYSCGQCGALFPTLDRWCDHQKSHAANNIFQCGECNRVFGTQEELDQHRTEHPNIKLKLYRCSNSNSYKTIADFSSTSSQTPNPFECDLCDKSFNTNKQLQKHFILHKQITNSKAVGTKKKKKKKGLYACLLCDKTYVLSSSLWKHRKVNHGVMSNKKKRVCTICNKLVGSVKAMWYHKKKFHSNIQKEEAPVVNHEREQRAVRNIKREIYDPEADPIDVKPFTHICEICNKSFPTLKGLSIHAKLHSHREHVAKSERPKCQVCNEDFLNVESLLDHMKSHSTKILNNILNIEIEKPQPQVFECPICKKTVQNNAGLASHLKTHAGEPGTHGMGINENKSFKCSACKMSLMSAVSLANHMRVHLRNGTSKLYTCAICKTKCTSALSLKGHYQSIHHLKNKMAAKISMLKSNAVVETAGERFACTECPKTFIRQNLLDSHMKIIHPEKYTKKFKCIKCSRFLPTATAYARHARQYHNRLVCTECNKFFDSEAALCSHKGWHNRKTPPPSLTPEELKCVACDEQFESKSEYVKHVHTHKEPFKCKYCSRVFSYLKPLKKHIHFIHSNEFARNKAIVKKTVPVTGKALAGKKLKNSFLRTVEVKTEPNADWPYKCTECHTGFLNAKKLRLHILSSHTIDGNV